MRDALISSDDEATDVGLDYDDVSEAEIFLTEDIAEGLVTSSQSQRCYIPNFCIIFWAWSFVPIFMSLIPLIYFIFKFALSVIY